MNESLEGKVLLVTGGTSGIGEACSRHFAALKLMPFEEARRLPWK